jgi:hypothetical protein
MGQFYTTSNISNKIKETPEGFIICEEVKIARDGSLTYMRGETPIDVEEGQNVTINRRPEDINNPLTIASFEGKPITLRHPTIIDNEEVNPENFQKLVRGVVQNVRPLQENGIGYLIADLLLMDAEAIRAVKEKELDEVSCGYESDYEQTAEGEGRQLNIKGNHLALVEAGRCGSECAITFDHLPTTIKKEGTQMKEQKITMKEKVLTLFGKALDEALPEDKDKEKDTDADPDKGKEESTADAKGLDALKSSVADLKKSLDEIKSMLKDKASDADADKDKDKDTDADPDKDKDKASDADKDKDKTADQETVARAEILVPSIDKTSDNLKQKALDAFTATADGKIIVASLLSGKTLDSSNLDMVFVSASEVVKAKRNTEQNKQATTLDKSEPAVMTASVMNERNAKKYGR